MYELVCVHVCTQMNVQILSVDCNMVTDRSWQIIGFLTPGG